LTYVLGLLLFPSVALFCLQLTRGEGPSPAAGDWSETGALEPQEALPTSFVAASLRALAAAPAGAASRRFAPDPFADGVTREMVAAHGDPYLWLFLSGLREGEMLAARRSGGVTTFGPPLPGGRGAGDGDILRALDQGLGGSFKQFFASVLARPGSDPDAEEFRVEENPFVRAMSEAKAAEPASAQAKPAGQDAAEAKAAPKPQPVQEPPAPTLEAAPAATTGAGQPAPVRPDLMLRVQGSTLDAVAVSRPSEGTFESAQAGTRAFDSITFSDVPDSGFALGASDFNRDGVPDVALYVPQQGLLRFFFGTPGGEFLEETRLVAGRDPGSIALGDFDGDGAPDIALSQLGTGLLTVFYGDSHKAFPRFKIFWLDTYRDYITASDLSGDGLPEIVGMTFANRASVLLDFARADAAGASRKLDYAPAYESRISANGAPPARISAALLGGALSVNLDNRQGNLVNALNVAAGLDAYVVAGDLDSTGRLSIGVATVKR
jgi:hypothetical protein